MITFSTLASAVPDQVTWRKTTSFGSKKSSSALHNRTQSRGGESGTVNDSQQISCGEGLTARNTPAGGVVSSAAPRMGAQQTNHRHSTARQYNTTDDVESPEKRKTKIHSQTTNGFHTANAHRARRWVQPTHANQEIERTINCGSNNTN